MEEHEPAAAAAAAATTAVAESPPPPPVVSLAAATAAAAAPTDTSSSPPPPPQPPARLEWRIGHRRIVEDAGGGGSMWVPERRLFVATRPHSRVSDDNYDERFPYDGERLSVTFVGSVVEPTERDLVATAAAATPATPSTTWRRPAAREQDERVREQLAELQEAVAASVGRSIARSDGAREAAVALAALEHAGHPAAHRHHSLELSSSLIRRG